MTGTARRWFREPMVWLLVALPLASVVATVLLIRVAGGGAPLDSAPEAVQRSAQVQQRDLTPDRRAAERGLATTARVHALDTGLALAIDARALPPGPYDVQLVHPGDSRGDVRATVTADVGGHLVLAAFDPAIAWRLRLSPTGGDWRLVGRWDPARPDAAVVLRPALDDGAPDAGAPR